MARDMQLTERTLLDLLAAPENKGLAAIFSPRSYPRRRIVFTPHDTDNLVFVVASGRIRIFLADEDKELTVSILKPGDIYSTHTRAYVQAYKDSTILVAELSDFQRQVSAYPELTYGIIGVLGDLLKKSFSHILNLAFKDVRRRLREFLAREARKNGQQTPDGVLVNLELTVEELAGLLGASRQTVSTALNDLAREGLIAKRGRGIYLVPDLARLRDAA